MQMWEVQPRSGLLVYQDLLRREQPQFAVYRLLLPTLSGEASERRGLSLGHFKLIGLGFT